jgi:hypothetical protein
MRREGGVWSDVQLDNITQDCQIIMMKVEEAIGGPAEDMPPVDWDMPTPIPKPQLKLCEECNGSGLVVSAAAHRGVDEL